MQGGAAARQQPQLAPVAPSGDRRSWLPELAWLLATALVATLVAVVDLKLWKMDADVPIFGANGWRGDPSRRSTRRRWCVPSGSASAPASRR